MIRGLGRLLVTWMVLDHWREVLARVRELRAESALAATLSVPCWIPKEL